MRPNFGLYVRIGIGHGPNFGPISVRIGIGHVPALSSVLAQLTSVILKQYPHSNSNE